MSRNAFFSSRSEKKNIFFDVDIVVKNNRNVVYRGLYSYRQRVRVIARFPKIFFVLFLHIKRVCKSFWRESLTRTSSHLHNAASALSNPSRCFQLSRERFRFFDIVDSPVSLILRTHSAAPRESTTFWPLWWRVSLSIRLYTTLNHIRFVKLQLQVYVLRRTIIRLLSLPKEGGLFIGRPINCSVFLAYLHDSRWLATVSSIFSSSTLLDQHYNSFSIIKVDM